MYQLLPHRIRPKEPPNHRLFFPSESCGCISGLTIRMGDSFNRTDASSESSCVWKISVWIWCTWPQSHSLWYYAAIWSAFVLSPIMPSPQDTYDVLPFRFTSDAILSRRERQELVPQFIQTQKNKLSVGESNPAFARDRRVY